MLTELARSEDTSANHVLVDLIEAGLQFKEAEKRHYLELVQKLSAASDSSMRQQIKHELARLTFGAWIDAEDPVDGSSAGPLRPSL